jgi:hypothetical protein
MMLDWLRSQCRQKNIPSGNFEKLVILLDQRLFSDRVLPSLQGDREQDM